MMGQPTKIGAAMSLYNLDRIFDPQRIAVVGASEKEGTIGNALMRNLLDGGFEGELFPVNPNYDALHGLKAYGSVAEVEHAPDLAVIATPILTVPDIVGECTKRGVGGGIIISAGGKESGQKGREIETRIEEEARKTGLRIIGPNCLGVICPGKKLNASFAAHMPREGKLAFVSQSGAICTAMLDLALKENMGFRHFVSIGSMLDVDFGDLIDYLGSDQEVSSVLLYIESLTNFRKFMSAARSVSRTKPIIALKAGRSKAGAKAAASHTGAMAGEDAVYDAAFKRAGIVRVNNLEDFFDCAEFLAKQPRPTGRRLVIITNAGGPGVMAADAVAEQGLELSPLSEETVATLNNILPPAWSHANPVDILGDASAERYVSIVDCCFNSREFDGMLLIHNPQATTDPTEVAKTLIAALKRKPYPVFTVWMGGVDVEKGRDTLNKAGFPTYDTPERAVRAFTYLYHYGRNLEMLQEVPPKLHDDIRPDCEKAVKIIKMGLQTKNGLLTEGESKALLSVYGIPVNRTEQASSLDEAVRLAREMGYPLAMKVQSRDIVHKSEAGGVQLDLRTEEDVRRAYGEIVERTRAYDPTAFVSGVTLQPMIQNPDYEILLGAKKDPNFGPVILFGLGGVFVEALGDKSIGLPPFNRTLAVRMMEETRAYWLLKGQRGRKGAELDLLEEMVVRLSQLLVDYPEIAELDMNPVIIKDGKPLAVDARVVIRASDVTTPFHLVISPYPSKYESMELTSRGRKVFVRPVKPEDAPLFQEFFNVLSPTAIYFRFFSPVKSLSPTMLARFTQIDYDREIALVAFDGEGDGEKMAGVARVIAYPEGTRGEFAIIVGDPWQGTGIGSVLLRRCLHLAKAQGMDTVEGAVLAENRQMLNLGRKLGFRVLPGEGAGEYKLSIDLSDY
jgi:acetyltransferase